MSGTFTYRSLGSDICAESLGNGTKVARKPTCSLGNGSDLALGDRSWRHGGYSIYIRLSHLCH